MQSIKDLYTTLRDDRSAQIAFIMFGAVFMVMFTFYEWDGLTVFADFLIDAIKSTPDFFEKIIDYFGAVPGSQLQRSAIAGAIAGAGLTALVLLSARGFLILPTPGTGATLIGIGIGVFAYYTDATLPNALIAGILVIGLAAYFYDEIQDFLIAETFFGTGQPESVLQRIARIPRAVWVGIITFLLVYLVQPGFWNALWAIIAMVIITALIYEKEFRAFFRPATLQRLATQPALTTLAIGLGIGAIGGALGGQILNYPLKHCTFAPDIDRVQYRLGLAITALSTLILLVPVWTFMNRRSSRRVEETVGYFRNGWLSYVLLLPSLLFLSVFLYYPAIQILIQSTMRLRRGNPRQIEYCLQNYLDLSESRVYQTSFSVTLWITVAVVIITMVTALGIAILASQKVRGANIYRTLLIWPYAVSPVVMGTIFLNLFRQGDIGIINYVLGELFHTQPDWLSDRDLAPWVIVLAAVWNGLGFNILFYVAGLQNIPKDLLEAAAIDGANRIQRFFRITLPLLSPFTFFLLVANVTYSFYGIYGVIDILTEGKPALGPAGRDGYATSVLIYEAYREAFRPDARLGEAAAQAVILFLLVAAITLIQFRYVERRVTYGG